MATDYSVSRSFAPLRPTRVTRHSPPPGAFRLQAGHSSSFEDLQSLAEGQLLGDVWVWLGLLAEIEVGLQRIVIRHVEELLQRGLDGRNGTHVLQVGTEALELEGCPHKDLGH